MKRRQHYEKKKGYKKWPVGNTRDYLKDKKIRKKNRKNTEESVNKTCLKKTNKN